MFLDTEALDGIQTTGHSKKMRLSLDVA